MNPAPFVSIPVFQGELRICHAFIGHDESLRLMQTLISRMPWEQEQLLIFGKKHPVPRLVAWVGDEGKNYRYSGVQHHPLPWTPELTDLKVRIEQYTGYAFNTVLLNWYRNGRDSMGWHADNEPELGVNPVIASLSLGERRLFRFRQTDNHRNSFGFPLENGSLLLMAGAIQHHWQHCIPKSAKPMGDRINLTFRTIH
ncbi:MAG: alpha-ketoglutarate-dependent dioxygenase AlkB [Bacteroidales bacterium]|nr:alpha-ketoglutarate-dependent dioxygenase AlkB [Bacteroidales bacterium]